MADLQELIARGRFIFSGAPKRLEVFKLINGKRTSKDIASKTGRSMSNILHDIEKLIDLELVRKKKGANGNFIEKDASSMYEKAPLIKHVSLSYFHGISKTDGARKKMIEKKGTARQISRLPIPTVQEILDICNKGESQLYEFKGPGTEMHKITKKIAGYLHTRNGGIIFYGIDDDGTIIGSDIKRQDFDQKLHNSIRYTLDPQPNITIRGKDVMGYDIILVIIPPWDRNTFYEYTKEHRYFIKKGTNVFSLKTEELNLLRQGKYVV